MSLLMQALKKAERAKQNSGEAELEKPSEAFDEILTLAPQDAAPAPAAAAPTPLSIEPMDGLSLSPMSDLPAPAPAPSHSPAPAASSMPPLDFANEGLPPVPPSSMAQEAIHDPVPPQARHQEAPMKAKDSGAPAGDAAPKPERAEQAGKAAGAGRRAAARAQAAKADSGDKLAMDPAKLRMYVLLGIVALIVAGYGFYFWRAINGPGSGGRLPMVPMPPPNATGATPAVVVAASAPAAAPAPEDLLPAAPPDKAQREREAQLAAQLAATQAQVAVLMQQARNPGPDTLPPVAAADSSEVRVARSTTEPPVDPSLSAAYQALSSNDLATASQQYETALRQDPNNRDALLGAAAVAARQQRSERAAALYTRLLELNPNDADALAGLVGERTGDPAQSERRLQAVLRTNPDAAAAQFALGNLYARQGRWSEAQQSYFRAYTAMPGNADYAFNLAIGLDRLAQSKLAQTYYQKALALAQDKPASFDRDAVHRRLQELNAASAR